MREFCQMHCVMDLAPFGLLHTGQGDPGRFRSGVEFDRQRLEMALFHSSVLESNGKWHDAMHHGSLAGKQQTRSFLRTGHEWLFLLI
jgi:hypothetical protein